MKWLNRIEDKRRDAMLSSVNIIKGWPGMGWLNDSVGRLECIGKVR
jgi:hypothetical protein